MFTRNVALTFLAEAFVLAANFLTGILLARTLSVADRGVMVLVMTLPWMVASFAGLGLPQANIYLVGRKGRLPGAVLVNALWLGLGLAALSVLPLYLFRQPLLEQVFKGLPAEQWAVVLVLIPLLAADGMLLSILRTRQRFDLFNLRSAVLPALTLAGFAAVLWLAPGDLRALVGVYAGVITGAVGLGLAFVHRAVPFSRPASGTPLFDPALAREALTFGLKSYLQNLLGALHYRLDLYLVAFFLAPEQVAFYGVAVSIAEVVWYIPDAVGKVLFPRLAHAVPAEVNSITARVTRMTLALVLLAAGVLLGLAWLAVPLVYGAPYQAAVPPFVVLLPGVIFMSVYKTLARSFTSRDRQQVTIISAAGALVLNLGLNLVLIPAYGILGAAAASSLSYTAAGLFLLAVFASQSRLRWQDVLLPRWAELVVAFQSVASLLGRQKPRPGLQ